MIFVSDLIGISENAPPRDYSLESSESTRVFNAFTSISIIAAIFGNGILPEIQVITSLLLNFAFTILCYAWLFIWIFIVFARIITQILIEFKLVNERVKGVLAKGPIYSCGCFRQVIVVSHDLIVPSVCGRDVGI